MAGEYYTTPIDTGGHFAILECMRKQTFQLLFEPDTEGGYTVTVPALPGCVTYGATIEEARLMAREAIELYLEDLAENHEKIPQTSETLSGTIDVDVAVAA